MNYRHGLCGKPIYWVWIDMHKRCNDPKHKGFKNYGGRGIRVCARWDDVATFAADMGPRPDGYTIERNDNDGNYCPENCRWATRLEQARNMRSNRRLTLNGETFSLPEWCERTGIKENTMICRIMEGWSDERILTTPLIAREDQATKTVVFNGSKILLTQLCRDLGLVYRLVFQRLQRGWTIEEAINTPCRPRASSK